MHQVLSYLCAVVADNLYWGGSGTLMSLVASNVLWDFCNSHVSFLITTFVSDKRTWKIQCMQLFRIQHLERQSNQPCCESYHIWNGNWMPYPLYQPHSMQRGKAPLVHGIYPEDFAHHLSSLRKLAWVVAHSHRTWRGEARFPWWLDFAQVPEIIRHRVRLTTNLRSCSWK